MQILIRAFFASLFTDFVLKILRLDSRRYVAMEKVTTDLITAGMQRMNVKQNVK